MAPPPAITGLIPTETQVGRGFNMQPNGAAAISVMGQDFRPGSVVMLNGVKTGTVFGGPDGLSAIVPPQVYSSPGYAMVQVQNPDGQKSGVVELRVKP